MRIFEQDSANYLTSNTKQVPGCRQEVIFKRDALLAYENDIYITTIPEKNTANAVITCLSECSRCIKPVTVKIPPNAPNSVRISIIIFINIDRHIDRTYPHLIKAFTSCGQVIAIGIFFYSYLNKSPKSSLYC